jgi:hypothetical protein
LRAARAEAMSESRPLIGQGGDPPKVSDYAAPSAPDGPFFSFAREVRGITTTGVPSYKVAGYFAAETAGPRGDAVYALNAVVQRNPGLPQSDVIGCEINVNNNDADMARDRPHWCTGLIVASGGEKRPGVGVHVGGIGKHNEWITGLKVEHVHEIGIEVGNPLGLIGTIVARQLHKHGETIVLTRNNDTDYGGSFLRCLTADGKGELLRIDFDGSVWCRGTKVIG